MVQLPCTYLTCKGGGKREVKGCMTKRASIIGEGSLSRLLCWGVPHIPKRLVVGQSNGSSLKGKKNWVHPSLINRNMNKYLLKKKKKKASLWYVPHQGVLDFCCSQCVLIKFSLGSQQVPQVLNRFPKVFSIVSHLIPYPWP
jgi:hypothetical protein